MKKQTFALFFGNKSFFCKEYVPVARREMKSVVEGRGYNTILMPEDETGYGGIETDEEGRKYAKFLKEHEGLFDGVIMSLPNFATESSAVVALRDCGVPILIQAYDDEQGKMDMDQRRDSFCGKVSIMNLFYQNNIKFTVYPPHTINPDTDSFKKQIDDFAAICRVVKGMKRFSVGAIGARTTAFKTVRFDEIALERNGITVETLDLSEVFERIKAVKTDSAEYIQKHSGLKGYTNWNDIPNESYEKITKLSVVLDKIVEEFSLSCLSLRCWNEFFMYLHIAPCVALGELSDRGIASACEVDIGNAIAMRALSLASNSAAACLDWNNNYKDDRNKCILFHCGPVAESLLDNGGKIVDHEIQAKAQGVGCGWGADVGRLAANDMTFSSSATYDGKLRFYVGEGKITKDKIDDNFFGAACVAEIADLQKVMLGVGKNGFRHHVSLTVGHYKDVLIEAYKNYLEYDIIEF